MKNTMKLVGIIALIAVVGFSFAACSNGSTSGSKTEFEGTWQHSNPDSGPAKFVFSGNTFTATSAEGTLTRTYKGTFTSDAATITFTADSGTSWSFTYSFGVEDGLGEYVNFWNPTDIQGQWQGWYGAFFKQ